MSTNAPTRHNPAALDFLKGISLGENTPTLRKRKSLGKVASSTFFFFFLYFLQPLLLLIHIQSKLSEVYPQKNQGTESKKAGGRGSREGEKDEKTRSGD